MEENLRETVEGLYTEHPGVGIVRPFLLLPGRIAISDTEDADGAGHLQENPFAGVRDEAVLAVFQTDGDDSQVAAVGLDGRAVGFQLNAGGLLRRF